MDAAWIGIIVAIGTSVITHVCVAIWWASKINTTLSFLQKAIETLNDTVIRHDADRYTKNDAAKDFAIRDNQLSALWRRIDEMKK